MHVSNDSTCPDSTVTVTTRCNRAPIQRQAFCRGYAAIEAATAGRQGTHRLRAVATWVVMLALSDAAGRLTIRHRGSCRPMSTEELGERLGGISPNALREVLAELHHAGLIDRHNDGHLVVVDVDTYQGRRPDGSLEGPFVYLSRSWLAMAVAVLGLTALGLWLTLTLHPELSTPARPDFGRHCVRLSTAKLSLRLGIDRGHTLPKLRQELSALALGEWDGTTWTLLLDGATQADPGAAAPLLAAHRQTVDNAAIPHPPTHGFLTPDAAIPQVHPYKDPARVDLALDLALTGGKDHDPPGGDPNRPVNTPLGGDVHDITPPQSTQLDEAMAILADPIATHPSYSGSQQHILRIQRLRDAISHAAQTAGVSPQQIARHATHRSLRTVGDPIAVLMGSRIPDATTALLVTSQAAARRAQLPPPSPLPTAAERHRDVMTAARIHRHLPTADDLDQALRDTLDPEVLQRPPTDLWRRSATAVPALLAALCSTSQTTPARHLTSNPPTDTDQTDAATLKRRLQAWRQHLDAQPWADAQAA